MYLGYLHLNLNQALRSCDKLNAIKQRQKEKHHKIAADIEKILDEFSIPQDLILYHSVGNI